jgi:hypothetical protein
MIAGVLGALTGGAAHGQTPPPDLEHVIQLYEQSERDLLERVQHVTDQLKATDALVERRVARVLEMICKVNDSPDSRSKIIQAKETLFDGIKHNLEFFVRERGMRLAALYQPTTRLSKEQLADDVRRLDQRIEQRVEQALALVASLPGEEAIAKDVWRYRDGNDDRGRNPSYSHQQRAVTRAGQLREKAAAALKASIGMLERSRVELEQARRLARTEEGRQFVDGLIKETNELVDKRREQVMVALVKTNPGTKKVGSQAAATILEMIQEEKLNFQRDNAEWIRLKNLRDVERERLYLCQSRLALARRQLRAVAVKPATDTTKVQ